MFLIIETRRVKEGTIVGRNDPVLVTKVGRVKFLANNGER